METGAGGRLNMGPESRGHQEGWQVAHVGKHEHSSSSHAHLLPAGKFTPHRELWGLCSEHPCFLLQMTLRVPLSPQSMTTPGTHLR